MGRPGGPYSNNSTHCRSTLAFLFFMCPGYHGHDVAHHGIPQSPVPEQAASFVIGCRPAGALVCHLWSYHDLAPDGTCAKSCLGYPVGHWPWTDRVFVEDEREKPVEAAVRASRFIMIIR